MSAARTKTGAAERTEEKKTAATIAETATGAMVTAGTSRLERLGVATSAEAIRIAVEAGL